MLKIFQARLQQYVNHELPDVQVGFRKGRRTRDQIANIRWTMEKARAFQKNIYFCFIDYAKAFDCVDHNKLWKISERDGNARPSDLPLEKPICRSGSNSQNQTWNYRLVPRLSVPLPFLKQEKEYVKAEYCHPAYLTYMQHFMRNTGLDEVQAGIKIARRNINNLRYADDTSLMEESEAELKSLLMKVQEESEKVGLKLNIWKTKIMASSPITSWEIDGETVETVADFTFLGSKNHCRR